MKKKRNAKPFISLTLAFLLAFGLVPAPAFAPATAQAAETPSGPLSGDIEGRISWELTKLDPPPADWNLVNRGDPYKLTLNGTGSMGDFSAGSPWQGYLPFLASIELSEGITDIGASAFQGCSSLTSVTLPDSVTRIEAEAFSECSLLETVVCGSGLSSIGELAFNMTKSLESIDLSRSSLTSLGKNVFNESTLPEITLPDGMTTIGESAFQNSNRLSTVVLPDSVTTIENKAFQDCSALSDISDLSRITSIGDSAFLNCSNLTSVSLGSGLTKIGMSSFQSCGLETLNVPSTKTCVIGDSAFRYCTALETVTLGSGIETIPSIAFSDCTKLTSVHLGNGLKSIGNHAFSSCAALSEIDLGTVETIGSYAFQNCGLVNGITLPETLKTIQSFAFSETDLSTFALPASVTTIEPSILAYCWSLKEITANGNACFQVRNDALCDIDGYAGTDSNGDPTIDRNRIIAYPAAKEVGSYTVPDSMETVDALAYTRSKMSEVILPDSVITLRDRSFFYCENLASVQIGKNTENIAIGSSGAFLGCAKLETVTTPSEDSKLKAVDNVLYKQNELYFYPFAKKDATFHVPETVTSVGSRAVSNIPALQELYLPQGLASISKEGIFNNPNLDSIYFSGNAPTTPSNSPGMSISANAQDLILYRPETAEGWDARGWSAFTLDTWEPENTEEDGGTSGTLTWHFRKSDGCLTLTGTPDVPDYDTDTALPPWHQYMGDIQTIETDGENLVQIGDYAFYGANRLLRVSTDVAPTKIGTASFADCGKLKYISFSEIAEIGDEAFMGDTDLASDLAAPWSLEHIAAIGARAFKNCTSVKSVDLGGAPLTEISDEAFAGCSALSGLTLSESLERIGTGTFSGCSALSRAAAGGRLVIPNSVSSIGAGAFKGCAALTNLDLPNKIAALERETLDGCGSLAELILPSKLAAIGENALRGCSALSAIEIPESVTAIAAGAFSGTAIADISFLGALPAIDEAAFSGCDETATKLFYRAAKDADGNWAGLDGSLNGLPVAERNRFYTAKRDHFSFANDASSFGYESGYRVPRQRYVDVLDSITTGSYYYAINKRWTGSCYGMAGVALEFYENIGDKDALRPESYGRAEDAYAVASPASLGGEAGKTLTKLIEGYQVSQYQPQISGCGGEIYRHRNDRAGLRKRITDFSRTGGLDGDPQNAAAPVIILAYSDFAGHALVPYSFQQADDGSFVIETYDANDPDKTRTVTMNRSMTSCSLGDFSYVDYETIANGMSDVTLYAAPADESLYLSVDKESGSVTDASGNSVEDIDGGYEQKPAASANDAFSGVRSYVLPNGSYTLSSSSPAQADPAEKENASGPAEAETGSAFYMASPANGIFAEIATSDENASLAVNTGDDEEKAVLTLCASEQAQEEETARAVLVNDSGMERVIEFSKYGNEDITVSLTLEDEILVTAPETAEIKIDGEAAAAEEGALSFSFETDGTTSPFRIKDLALKASCDKENKLDAAVSAAVIYQKFEPLKDAELTAEFFDADKNLVASYTEKRDLDPGLNFFDSVKSKLETAFAQEEGEAAVYCRLTVSGQGQSASSLSETTTVVLTKQEPPVDPDNPGDPDDPDNPGDPDDPDNPGDPDDPDNPGDPDDPDNPGDPDDPDNPGDPDDPGKPGDPDDPDNPGDPDDPDNPGDPDDPDNPGDPDDPGDPGDPDDPDDDKDGNGSSNLTGGSGETQPPAPKPNVPQAVPATAVTAGVKKITIGIGESFQVRAKVAPSDATDKSVTYRPSNKKISVTAGGKLTGRKAGTAWLTVSPAGNTGAKAARIKVTVKKAPKSIRLNAKEKKLKKGKTFQIKAKLPKGTASRKITYTSSKPSVVTVTSGGKARALKKGRATITAKTFNGKKAKLKITVR